MCQLTIAWHSREGLCRFRSQGQSPARETRGVVQAEDEDAFAPMRCADFSRTAYSPRTHVTCALQFSEDMEQYRRACRVGPAVPCEFCAEEALDIFEEDRPWPTDFDSGENIRKEVPWVLVPGSLAGLAERLAREAATEDVHATAKLSPRESFKIRPDRCRVQGALFHLCNQIRAGEGFDFTKSDCPQIWDCSLKSEINASVSGAEADVCDGCICFGSIHIFFAFHVERYRPILNISVRAALDSPKPVPQKPSVQ